MSGWLFLNVGERMCGFSFSKYSTAGPLSGSSVHLCRHDLLPHDTDMRLCKRGQRSGAGTDSGVHSVWPVSVYNVLIYCVYFSKTWCIISSQYFNSIASAVADIASTSEVMNHDVGNPTTMSKLCGSPRGSQGPQYR